MLAFCRQAGFFSIFTKEPCQDTPIPSCMKIMKATLNSSIFNLRVNEMMRVQRDTKRSMLEDICEKIEVVGRELTSGSLSVTGHSLGGDLATVAGFFLASNPTLQLASAVRVYTFASSPVGCNTFQHTYKYLEETGRLQHARFTNLN